MVFVVGRYSDGLTVTMILLDPPSALELLDHVSMIFPDSSRKTKLSAKNALITFFLEG